MAGGIVADETTFAQLLDQAYVVWLQASPAEHMRRVMEQGDFRPMAHNREAMSALVSVLNARAGATGGSIGGVRRWEGGGRGWRRLRGSCSRATSPLTPPRARCRFSEPFSECVARSPRQWPQLDDRVG